MKDIIVLTKELLSFQSQKDNLQDMKKIVAFVKDFCKDLHCATLETNGITTLIFTFNKTTTPTLFLHGHLDVVPAHEDVYRTREIGTKLYGRGTNDMKAACAVMMIVMNELSRLPSPPNIGLMLVTDEETGGFDGALQALELGYRPKVFLSGEPTNLRIGNNAKGIFEFEVRAKGKSYHSSQPWNGENAVSKICDFVSQVRAKYPIPPTSEWVTSANISFIHGGTILNSVPADCSAGIDIRHIPQDNPRIFIEKILGDLEITKTITGPCCHCDAKNPYLMQLEKIIESVTKKKHEFLHKDGGSDARHYSNVGIPAFVFGPCGANSHADDEYVERESLTPYYEILKEFCLAVDKI